MYAHSARVLIEKKTNEQLFWTNYARLNGIDSSAGLVRPITDVNRETAIKSEGSGAFHQESRVKNFLLFRLTSFSKRIVQISLSSPLKPNMTGLSIQVNEPQMLRKLPDIEKDI